MTMKPQILPSSGGSYIRDDKGKLTPVKPQPAKPAPKPIVKEG